MIVKLVVLYTTGLYLENELEFHMWLIHRLPLPVPHLFSSPNPHVACIVHPVVQPYLKPNHFHFSCDVHPNFISHVHDKFLQQNHSQALCKNLRFWNMNSERNVVNVGNMSTMCQPMTLLAENQLTSNVTNIVTQFVAGSYVGWHISTWLSSNIHNLMGHYSKWR